MPPTLRPAAGPVACGLVALGLFAASPVIAGSDRVHAEETLVAYDPVLSGASAVVDVEYDAGGETRFRMRVTGATPRTTYLVRAHVGGCEQNVDDLGVIFQLAPNPDRRKPEDRRYRNAVNEVWSVIRTDATGKGTGRAIQPWQFPPSWRPGSIVLHDVIRLPGPVPPRAGTPLACLEVPF